MALDDVERNAEKSRVVENDPLAGEAKALEQLDGAVRRITSEIETKALQLQGTVPDLQLDDKADGTLHVFNNKSADYISFQPHHPGTPGDDARDPFQKEWVNKNEGMLDGVWRGIKTAFAGKETLADKAREREVANLTPEQRKQYEEEEKALKDWWVREATMESLTYKGSPMPDCPIHREVDSRVHQFEQDVKEQVLQEMTPAQRRELEQEQRDFERQQQEIETRRNPLGGPLYQPDAKPGPTMEYYKKMVQKRAEERLG